MTKILCREPPSAPRDLQEGLFTHLAGLEDAHYHRHVDEAPYSATAAFLGAVIVFGAALREAARLGPVGRAVGFPGGGPGEAAAAWACRGEARVRHAVGEFVRDAAVRVADGPPIPWWVMMVVGMVVAVVVVVVTMWRFTMECSWGHQVRVKVSCLVHRTDLPRGRAGGWAGGWAGGTSGRPSGGSPGGGPGGTWAARCPLRQASGSAAAAAALLPVLTLQQQLHPPFDDGEGFQAGGAGIGEIQQWAALLRRHHADGRHRSDGTVLGDALLPEAPRFQTRRNPPSVAEGQRPAGMPSATAGTGQRVH